MTDQPPDLDPNQFRRLKTMLENIERHEPEWESLIAEIRRRVPARTRPITMPELVALARWMVRDDRSSIDSLADLGRELREARQEKP